MPTTNDVLLRALSARYSLEPWEQSALAALSSRELAIRRDAVVPDEGGMLFLVLEGWVCGYKILNSGERQICALHVDGDIPDFRRLVLPPAGLEYRSLTVCRIGLISAAAMRELCRKSPGVAHGVMRNLTVISTIAEEWIVNIGRRRAINRVAHLICELAVRLEAIKGSIQARYVIPLTQTDIGDATGLSAVHVNRVLQELRTKRLLEFRGGQFFILDRQRLIDLAGFDPEYLDRAPSQ